MKRDYSSKPHIAGVWLLRYSCLLWTYRELLHKDNRGMTLQRIAQLLVELLMHCAHFGVSLLMWCDNIISLPAGVSG